MKVAIVIVGRWNVATFSIDPRLLVEGLSELGHDATIVCHNGSVFPPATPVLTVAASRLQDPGFWRECAFDAVVVFSWLHSNREIIASAARSGAFVISKGDTDGVIGVRAHPRLTFGLAVSGGSTFGPRLRNASFWARKFVYLDREQAIPILANLEQADATIVETEKAREGVLRFLRRSGGPAHLAEKVHVVANPIAGRFTSQAVTAASKERVIYAIGRWEAPEKNRALLVSALRRYLASDSSARAVVAGSGGEDIVRDLAGSRVEYLGHIDQDSLVELAARARICLVTSRSESFHLGAHEALAMGATVVGTPIPVVRSMSANGAFGLVAKTHRARAVETALAAEMRTWDEGGRDPAAIADYWRCELAPTTVAARLVGLIEGS